MIYFVSSSYYDDNNETKILAFNVKATDDKEATRVALQEVGLFGVVDFLEIFDDHSHLISRVKI